MGVLINDLPRHRRLVVTQVMRNGGRAMVDSGNAGRQPRQDPFTSQLREFDSQLLNLRAVYESLTLEQRDSFRDCVQRAKALDSEGGEWPALIMVRMQHDLCDEDGETVDWSDAELSKAHVD
jgi:hypothetical protein